MSGARTDTVEPARRDAAAPPAGSVPPARAALALWALAVAAVGCGSRWDEETTAVVERGPFEIEHVVEDGELAALRTYTVSAREHGEISFLVKDLAHVKKGDVLVELDKTETENHLKQLRDELVLAEKRLTEALRNQEIRTAQAEVDLRQKEAALRLAEVRLSALRAGARPDDVLVAEKDLEAAAAALKFAASSLADTEVLFGKAFATRSELDGQRVARELAVTRYEKARMELERLRAGPSSHDLRPSELAVEDAKLELEAAREETKALGAELRQSAAGARSGVSSLKMHIKRHEEEIEHYTIRAPRDGLVTRCTRHWERGKLDVGSHVWTGAGIVELPDLSEMKVKIRIPETLVRRVAVGDAVEVELDDLPGERLGGRIGWIDMWARDRNADLAEADMQHEGLSGVRVFRADVELDRKDEGMRLGSKATVLLRARLEDVVHVDRRAVVRLGGRPHARVIRGDHVEFQPVVLGESNETSYVVKRGLAPGTRVALADGS